MPGPDIIHHTLTEPLSGEKLEYLEVVGDGPPVAAYIAGIHGNETEVIEPFFNELVASVRSGVLKKSFIFIKHAHPAAIAAGTRKGNDIDFNRRGDRDLSYVPVKLVIEALDRFPSIQTCITVHQDNDRDREFYMYLSRTNPLNLKKEALIDRSRRWMASALWKAGFDQYSGLDDEDLGNYVRYGRVITEADDSSVERLISVRKGITTLCLEFPGQANPEHMKKIVNIVQSKFTNPVVEGGAI